VATHLAVFGDSIAWVNIHVGYRTESVAEYWIPGRDTPSPSLETAPSATEVTQGLHLAFEAEDRRTVDTFHRAALASDGVIGCDPDGAQDAGQAGRVRPHSPGQGVARSVLAQTGAIWPLASSH